MRKLILAAAIGAASVLASSSAHAALAYGISTQNSLFSFDTQTPNSLISAKFVTGLQQNELILGIDARPSFLSPGTGASIGTIYAIGSSNRLYTLNPATGAATQIGPVFTDASNGANAVALDGNEFGFDFNPDIDRIRVTSDTDQNLVLNPNTGQVQLKATAINGAAGNPNIVGSAYDQNFLRTSSQITAQATQLYGIDSVADTLVKQANNAGTITTVAPLSGAISNVTNLLGFDIQGASNGFISASSTINDTTKLYSINLATGVTALLGEIGGGLAVRDITVAVPEPTTLGLIGGAAVALLRRRTRR